MPNIAAVLKQEISRVARKEIRSETESLKKLAAQQRTALASLRRELEALKREMRGLARRSSKTAEELVPGSAAEVTKRRFSAARLAAHRQKLGLSAKDYGSLAGVSGLTIYKWESGTVRPRAAQLAGLSAIRGIGKREAMRRLDRDAG
jgi:DNA-binding transcriptional regulator YiaG